MRHSRLLPEVRVAIDGGGCPKFSGQMPSMYENGDEYAGKVYVSSVFLSPLSPDLGEEMPGDLLGGSASGISCFIGNSRNVWRSLKRRRWQKTEYQTR
jgi:hypothetical protein